MDAIRTARPNAQPVTEILVPGDGLWAGTHRSWALTVQVLGDFRLWRDGTVLEFGAKTPVRCLDILRVLAVARGHTCLLEHLHDWLWPDADGDKAKAACDQALHRLRKLLGDASLVIQCDGKLRLSPQQVWVDLAAWEQRLAQALDPEGPAGRDEAELERVFFAFAGPLLPHERDAVWALPVAERVRSKLIDLAIRLGIGYEQRRQFPLARAIYLHALEFYPASTRLYEALIRTRLAQGDRASALEDYERYERIRRTRLETPASTAIRGLVAPLLDLAAPVNASARAARWRAG